MKKLQTLLDEAIKLDVEKGDIILTGRFKNKRRVVKTIGTDRFGQPTINGKSILKFKIEKHMPKNKMSAKTRKEMNEMKHERQGKYSLRNRLLQENTSHFDKLIDLLSSEDSSMVKQAISLGEGLQIFEIISEDTSLFDSYTNKELTTTEYKIKITPEFHKHFVKRIGPRGINHYNHPSKHESSLEGYCVVYYSGEYPTMHIRIMNR